MNTKEPDDQYSKEETVRRRDEAIRRTVNMPPKPNKDYIGKSAPPPRREPKNGKKGRR